MFFGSFFQHLRGQEQPGALSAQLSLAADRVDHPVEEIVKIIH